VTPVIVGAIGFLIGLVSHDLAVQSLGDTTPLRPFTGICPRCRGHRGWLRLTCPDCGRRIEREPVLAVLSAALALAILQLTGVSWLLVPYLGFLLLSLALFVTDVDEFRIVDRINLRGTLVLAVSLAAAALLTGDGAALVRGLLGASAYFAGATLLWLAVRGRGFGAGDVKLAPLLGLFTGFVSWGTLGWSVFATALIGGVLAMIMMAFGAARMKTELPYGPPMIIGSWLALTMAGIGSIPLPS
jgi:leader peptidase (prepilin peptidase)/N-methyltransferase